jgi:hypothetical protein
MSAVNTFAYYIPRESIEDEIRRTLPDFVNGIKSCLENNVDSIVLHQDAFASNLDVMDILLLGKAIKFAGFYGINLNIIGKHRDTINKSGQPKKE